MLRSILGVMAFLAMLIPSQPTRAGLIIDQQFTSLTPTNINLLDGSRELSQSFTPVFDNVAGARINILTSDPTGGLGDVTISLFDNSPLLGGNLLSSATATNVGGPNGTFFDVTTFWTPVAVVPEVELFLVFSSSNPFFHTAGQGSGNPYTRGDYYINGVVLGKGPEQTFATFTDTKFGAIVPEPSSLALLATGAIGLIGYRRRKRKMAA